jgi:hypothetical protein
MDRKVIFIRHKQVEFGTVGVFLEKFKISQEKGEKIFRVILPQKGQLPAPFSTNRGKTAIHDPQAAVC